MRELAEERGDFHEGVPAIDGGWSKRSHRHSYNAKSGVAIIVRQATGKLLLRSCISVSETSIAQLAHRVLQKKSIQYASKKPFLVRSV